MSYKHRLYIVFKNNKFQKNVIDYLYKLEQFVNYNW